MNKIFWSVVLVVFVLTSAVFFASLEAGFTWQAVLLSVLAALAGVVGAFFAPARLPRRAEDGTPQGAWETRKLTQVVAGAVVSVVIAFVFRVNPGMAALVGIVAALLVGALLPAPADGRADT